MKRCIVGWMFGFGNNKSIQAYWMNEGMLAHLLYLLCVCVRVFFEIVHSYNRIHLGCFINDNPFLISAKRIVEQSTYKTYTLYCCTFESWISFVVVILPLINIKN